MHRNQKGFGTVEAFLILLVVGLIGFSGLYIWSSHHKAKVNQGKINTIKIYPMNTSVPPRDFINSLLSILASGDNNKLSKYLTPVEQQFREEEFTGAIQQTPQCKKYFNCNAGVEAKIVGIIPSSLLTDPENLKKQSPAVVDFTFKDGTTGKSVIYKEVRTEADPGTTYYVFNLLPNGESWLLNDYFDIFSDLSSGQKLDSHMGLRELTSD
jgi:hypothetical protein